MRSVTISLLLVSGILMAPGASSLQQPSTPTRNRRFPGAKLFMNPREQVLERTRIRKDTSITNNPAIPTLQPTTPDQSSAVSSSRVTSRVPSWMRYVIPSRKMMPEIFAEAFGTFLLLQLALGIVLSATFTQSMQGVFPIAILTGMAITAACAAVSSKCAAHFNPSITFAMCLYRDFGWTKFLPYVGAQLVGATAAATVNYGLYASRIAEFEATHGIIRSSLGGLQTAKTMGCYFASPISPLTAFFAESLGTFCLAAVVFALTSNKNYQARGLWIPPIIGSTVALIISIIGPISCASLNPARELGPRLVLKLFGWSSQVAFQQLGLYVLAAMVGATAGGFFVEKFLYPEDKAYEIGSELAFQ